VKRVWIAILLAALACGACKRPPNEGPVPGPAVNQNAIKALGSTVPAPNYDQSYWLKQHDANSPEWQEAKRLCEQTVLASYPNCLPVNDIFQTDQREKAIAAQQAAAKIEEMGRHGYDYDEVRKAWMPTRKMLAAGCTTVFQGAAQTWQCPQGAELPQGIPDPDFINKLSK
jgi:hypothetical protein